MVEVGTRYRDSNACVTSLKFTVFDVSRAMFE